MTFATGVTLQQNWIDVSNPAGYESVLGVFTGNSLEADGGTNLDAGLTYAEYLLKQDTMKNATKNVIALTDGEPTYYLSTSYWCNDQECDGVDNRPQIGEEFYYVHGRGDACSTNTKSATDNAANALKNNNFSDLYTICFGVAEGKMKRQWNDGGFLGEGHWSYWDITVGQYLRSIASSKDGKRFAYTADNAEQLNTAFAAITDTIVSGLDTGTVRDKLPTAGITAKNASGEEIEIPETWDLERDFEKKTETPTTTGDKKVTTYTYTKTYYVTINPETVVKTKIGNDEYAPLNGETTLTVEVAGEEKTIPFPIPAGKVTMPSHKVTYKIDGEQYGDVDTVEFGTEVTVRENPTKTGYSFSGWSTTDATVTDGKFTMPDKDVTLTGSWTQTTANVNFNGYIKKCLEVAEGSTLPENYEETFDFIVFIDGNEQNFVTGSVTMDAAETSNVTFSGTTPLTVGPHTFTVKETAPTNGTFGMTYDITEKNFALMVNADGTYTFGHVNGSNEFAPAGDEEPKFVTITNTYTQPTETFDLNTLITKNFEARTDSKPIPNGNYTFTAQIFEADDTWQQVGESPVYTGTATLNGAASGAAFDFGSSRNPTLASGTHRYLVKEEHGGETIDGITYDSTVYRLTITVSEDGTQPNVQIEAEPQASVLSVQSVEFTSKIIFTNTYFEEKDPNALYLDFSKYVQKELTATGSKTASDVKFRVIVNGMESPIMMYNAGEEEVSTYVEFNPRYRTVLDVNFASITGGNTETKDFTGSYVEIDQVGIYYFELNEEDGKRTGVTYDDSTYKVYVYVKREGDKLVVDSFDIYKDGWSVAGETITFHNTIDTGRDDYIPIIIPTIINKDTGMLNKTDHFAYVIGYPDGTVHPNGQITRAEVATIFFRLLKDEVRDGAFTTSNSYSDVAYGKWYSNPISTMSALGIITGYPDGTFKPNKPITRAEFAAIAARFDETQSGKSATFSDVIGHWAAKEIGIAYANEWIKGYPDGTFKPDQNITRAEAMTMINRVLERKPESPADLLTNMNKWTDNMDTSKWYYLDVQEATNSHAYTRKTFNYELWRQMLNDPDWSRYER